MAAKGSAFRTGCNNFTATSTARRAPSRDIPVNVFVSNLAIRVVNIKPVPAIQHCRIVQWNPCADGESAPACCTRSQKVNNLRRCGEAFFKVNCGSGSKTPRSWLFLNCNEVGSNVTRACSGAPCGRACISRTRDTCVDAGGSCRSRVGIADAVNAGCRACRRLVRARSASRAQASVRTSKSGAAQACFRRLTAVL